MTATVFAERIFPGFPFTNDNWVAIAFDRDNYDNTRMPEWFFREAQAEFHRPGDVLLVKGYGEQFEKAGGVLEVPFEWSSYKAFMLSPENYSPEYQLKSSGIEWAFWADPEISVWGGSKEAMKRIFDRRGGRGAVLSSMFEDFHLTDFSRNRELQEFLRGLVAKAGD
jgi:hypothetical protein